MPQEQWCLRTRNRDGSLSDRFIRSINGMPFYCSTGHNSGLPETWLPFFGILETSPAPMLGWVRGWFIKPTGHRQYHHTPIPLNVINEMIRSFASSAQYSANLSTVGSIQGYFDSLPALLFSSLLGGGIWSTPAGEQFSAWLQVTYPAFFARNPPVELTVRTELLDASENDEGIYETVNQWLWAHSGLHLHPMSTAPELNDFIDHPDRLFILVNRTLYYREKDFVYSEVENVETEADFTWQIKSIPLDDEKFRIIEALQDPENKHSWAQLNTVLADTDYFGKSPWNFRALNRFIPIKLTSELAPLLVPHDPTDADPRIEAIKDRLQRYIDLFADGHYRRGLVFFRQSRGINRQANVLTAQALLNQLNQGASLDVAFNSTNLNILRNGRIVLHHLHRQPGFVARGINGRLKDIIDTVRQMENQEDENSGCCALF